MRRLPLQLGTYVDYQPDRKVMEIVVAQNARFSLEIRAASEYISPYGKVTCGENDSARMAKTRARLWA
jgi:hypothetical protein